MRAVAPRKREGDRWYENPDRKCKDDYRFTNLPTGRNGKIEAGQLIYLCMQCPVLAECYAETQKYTPKACVQGGELWA